jgi:hypothetical protein
MSNNVQDQNSMQQIYQMLQQGQMPINNQNPYMMNQNFFFNPNNNMMWNNGMNNGMPFMFPNNFNFQNNNINQNFQPQNNVANWTLIFERKYDNNRVNVQINSNDTVAAAFSKYRIKSLEEIPLKFTLNGKQLDPNLTVSASGLHDNAVITVEKISFNQPKIPSPPPKGFWSLIFERKGDTRPITIQIESNKKVKDAVNSYKNKVQAIDDMIFIFNSKTLNLDMSLVQAGIHDGSKILVITTSDIEGA